MLEGITKEQAQIINNSFLMVEAIRSTISLERGKCDDNVMAELLNKLNNQMKETKKYFDTYVGEIHYSPKRLHNELKNIFTTLK